VTAVIVPFLTEDPSLPPFSRPQFVAGVNESIDGATAKEQSGLRVDHVLE
jgi:hypothetical protein